MTVGNVVPGRVPPDGGQKDLTLLKQFLYTALTVMI